MAQKNQPADSSAVRNDATAANLGTAERYIAAQSQMLDPQQPRPASTPMPGHDQLMKTWREKQSDDRSRRQPFQYKYGPPPSTSKR